MINFSEGGYALLLGLRGFFVTLNLNVLQIQSGSNKISFNLTFIRCYRAITVYLRYPHLRYKDMSTYYT